MQRKEENRFLNDSILLAEDECTKMAKAEDNPCPFKEAVNENYVLQPRQGASNSVSIVQSAKNICYSVGQAFHQARRYVQHGFDSHTVRFHDNVMLATYNDCEVSGPIKILHVPALILHAMGPKIPCSHVRPGPGRLSAINPTAFETEKGADTHPTTQQSAVAPQKAAGEIQRTLKS